MSETATSPVLVTNTVKIAGLSGTVKVKVNDGATYSDVLVEALTARNDTHPDDVADAVNRLAIVVNGEDARPQDIAQEGAQVAAAPNVSNG